MSDGSEGSEHTDRRPEVGWRLVAMSGTPPNVPRSGTGGGATIEVGRNLQAILSTLVNRTSFGIIWNARLAVSGTKRESQSNLASTTICRRGTCSAKNVAEISMYARRQVGARRGKGQKGGVANAGAVAKNHADDIVARPTPLMVELPDDGAARSKR